MRLDLMDEAALRACSPELLITLITRVQQRVLSSNGAVLADDACGASRSAAVAANPGGAADLHAALSTASEKPPAPVAKRHRAKEFTRVFRSHR